MMLSGKYGGAGAAVPITGFANAVVAPAMEYKAEGPVLGSGSKIFSLAGPVILYGVGLELDSGGDILAYRDSLGDGGCLSAGGAGADGALQRIYGCALRQAGRKPYVYISDAPRDSRGRCSSRYKRRSRPSRLNGSTLYFRMIIMVKKHLKKRNQKMLRSAFNMALENAGLQKRSLDLMLSGESAEPAHGLFIYGS